MEKQVTHSQRFNKGRADNMSNVLKLVQGMHIHEAAQIRMMLKHHDKLSSDKFEYWIVRGTELLKKCYKGV